LRDNAAAFTDEVTQGGKYTDGAGNVRRVSPKLRGFLGPRQADTRQLFHYGNNEGKWAPTTGLREHQYAGYLDDYYAVSRGLSQGTPQTPEQKALTALERKRAFQESCDTSEETAPDNILKLNTP
jgi:hypothetical protein